MAEPAGPRQSANGRAGGFCRLIAGRGDAEHQAGRERSRIPLGAKGQCSALPGTGLKNEPDNAEHCPYLDQSERYTKIAMSAKMRRGGLKFAGLSLRSLRAEPLRALRQKGLDQCR